MVIILCLIKPPRLNYSTSIFDPFIRSLKLMTYPDIINPKLVSDLSVSTVDVRKILSAKHMDLTNCPPPLPAYFARLCRGTGGGGEMQEWKYIL